MKFQKQMLIELDKLPVDLPIGIDSLSDLINHSDFKCIVPRLLEQRTIIVHGSTFTFRAGADLRELYKMFKRPDKKWWSLCNSNAPIHSTDCTSRGGLKSKGLKEGLEDGTVVFEANK